VEDRGCGEEGVMFASEGDALGEALRGLRRLGGRESVGGGPRGSRRYHRR
jgi:hypothetical protein